MAAVEVPEKLKAKASLETAPCLMLRQHSHPIQKVMLKGFGEGFARGGGGGGGGGGCEWHPETAKQARQGLCISKDCAGRVHMVRKYY